MGEVETEEESRGSNEKFWFTILGVLTFPWLLVFIPQWFSWAYFFEFFGFMAALAGTVVALPWLFAAAVLRSKRMYFVAIGIGVSSLAVLAGLPTWLKTHATLFAYEGHYRSVIDEIKRNSDNWHEKFPDDHILVDGSSKAPRVAFCLENGMIDDFGAIVYDPSGVVALESSSENKEVFEGILGFARHIRGPWYYGILYPD